jgi:hypothetical protein
LLKAARYLQIQDNYFDGACPTLGNWLMVDLISGAWNKVDNFFLPLAWTYDIRVPEGTGTFEEAASGTVCTITTHYGTYAPPPN